MENCCTGSTQLDPLSMQVCYHSHCAALLCPAQLAWMYDETCSVEEQQVGTMSRSRGCYDHLAQFSNAPAPSVKRCCISRRSSRPRSRLCGLSPENLCLILPLLFRAIHRLLPLMYEISTQLSCIHSHPKCKAAQQHTSLEFSHLVYIYIYIHLPENQKKKLPPRTLTLPYHTLSYRIVPYHTISYHIVPCRAVFSVITVINYSSASALCWRVLLCTIRLKTDHHL